MDLGSIGVWSFALRNGDQAQICEAAVELEELGYGTIWFPGGRHEGLAELVNAILGATKRLVVATGIVSVWTNEASDIAADHAAIQKAHPGRFLLGLGVSHAMAVERSGLHYDKPLQKMVSYLDELDHAAQPVPKAERLLAALGPKMLELSGRRTLGTHPYFVPPAHTRVAREALGPEALVAPEQMIVLETDATKARAIARGSIGMYLGAPNYTNNLLRLGFTAADFTGGGSDHVVDEIVAWGTPAKILDRINQHHDAGADHVCVQVLTGGDRAAIPMDGWRQLAKAMKS
ncbi:MAG: LLM class F420-dependent oxidoreductase [Chloroflexota bacterium]